MKHTPVRGWKGQSILVNSHLTQRTSKARAQGVLPLFAAKAISIASNAARVAGMATKRWRHGEPARMTLMEVRRLRALIDEAFEDLEREILTRQDTREATVNPAVAETNYEAHGLLGLNALALMEEAGQLAETLAKAADGRSTVSLVRASIEDEAADVRTWLHLIDNALGIDPVGTTQSKWDRLAAELGDAAEEALAPKKIDQTIAAASMAALARSVGN